METIDNTYMTYQQTGDQKISVYTSEGSHYSIHNNNEIFTYIDSIRINRCCVYHMTAQNFNHLYSLASCKLFLIIRAVPDNQSTPYLQSNS